MEIRNTFIGRVQELREMELRYKMPGFQKGIDHEWQTNGTTESLASSLLGKRWIFPTLELAGHVVLYVVPFLSADEGGSLSVPGKSWR